MAVPGAFRFNHCLPVNLDGSVGRQQQDDNLSAA